MELILDIAEDFQSWLLNDFQESDFSPQVLIESQFEDPLHLAQFRLAKRISKGVRSYLNGEASELDLAVLLRQGIYAFEKRLWISPQLWEPLSLLDQRAGVYASAKLTDRIELTAQNWDPNWLHRAESIGRLETRKHYPTAPASGTLKRAYGFSTYQSEAQKAAVEECEFAAPGSTTLVTLPTGGGKSLCAILPAWRRSAGGTMRGGTTIVVVPTVALAIDQHASAQKYFQSTLNQDYVPKLWIGSTSQEHKELIREGVESGTVPLVFTSPESLLQSSLGVAVKISALRGNLASIVIDEAHIVATWGAQFRVEFQLLGAYLRQLNVDSRNELRTILLSATIDYSTEETLRHLFSYGAFSILRANAVRPEPEWWFNWSDDDQVRIKRVMEALPYLPRPVILYVSTLEDANNWMKELRSAGYQRVGTFTGQTADSDRDSMLQRWRDDGIDIMVATSAFGLGVDKPDVRTVVHACIPETTDRFYQEVGRGGRDGQSCVSLICATPRDFDVAFNLTKASRISTNKAIQRWIGMRDRAKPEPEDDSILNLDLDAPPRYAMDMLPGERHRDWNMHTLLLLQRAHLLELLSVPKRETIESKEDSDVELHSISVRVKSIETLDGSSADLYASLDPFRQKEREYVNRQVRQMKDLVKERSSRAIMPTDCISTVVASLYPDCARACGGCPECRRTGRTPYSESLHFYLDHLASEQSPVVEGVHGTLAELLGDRARLTVNRLERSSLLHKVLGALVQNGIVQLVIPDEYLRSPNWVMRLIDELAQSAYQLHVVVPEAWIRARHDVNLRSVPTVILYPDDDNLADSLHRAFVDRWPSNAEQVPVVNLIREGTFLRSESGRFVDRVPGIVIREQTLLSGLENASEGWF